MKIGNNKADKDFSLYVRTRDHWTCQRCHTKYPEGSQGLHNSHYWSRRHWSTRFDPNNCIALCFGCHQIWGHGDGRDEYKAFMIKKLGQKGFDALEYRHQQIVHRDIQQAIEWVRGLLDTIKEG